MHMKALNNCLAAHHSKQAGPLLLAGTWLISKACIRAEQCGFSM